MRPCNILIEKTIELAQRMAEVADEGEKVREDDGCGILYSVLRDSAYRIRNLALKEKENHIMKGKWN